MLGFGVNALKLFEKQIEKFHAQKYIQGAQNKKNLHAKKLKKNGGTQKKKFETQKKKFSAQIHWKKPV
jgi:hypothetical protein